MSTVLKRFKLYSLLSMDEQRRANAADVRNSYLDDLTVSELNELSKVLQGLQADLFTGKVSVAGVVCETLYLRASLQSVAS
jgi:hypothetical protein